MASKSEIHKVVLALHKDSGGNFNEFCSLFTQYMLETHGVEFNCPVVRKEKAPMYSEPVINHLSTAKDRELKAYWANRIFNA